MTLSRATCRGRAGEPTQAYNAAVLKIAFIGTHGVGKTTLCYDLAALLKRESVQVDIVKEVARDSPLPINRQTSLEAQLWILTTQVASEIRCASQNDVVVCDRSALDNYAYLMFATGRQRGVEQFVDHWLKTYDLLFKVPMAGPASEDGVRDTDLLFMRSIDALVDELLARKGVPHEVLPVGRRAEWVSVVRERVLGSPALVQRKL